MDALLLNALLDYEHVNELVDLRALKFSLVQRHFQYGHLLLFGEAARQVGLVFLYQERDALLAPPAVANGIFYLYPPGF